MLELGVRLTKIIALRGQEPVSLLELLQLVDRVQIDVAEPAHLSAQVGNLTLHLLPILLLVFVLLVASG